MGTNFYLVNKQWPNGQLHVGKRSAAGLYCFDCSLTLCVDGEYEIHSGKSRWYKACPVCGQEREQESLEESSVGLELGFNNCPPTKKTGVRGCSSFSWAMPAEGFYRDLFSGSYTFQDEYGQEYDHNAAKAVISDCPIHFTHFIGQEFS